MLPSKGLYLKEYTVATPSIPHGHYFLNITVKQSAIPSTLVDDIPLSNYTLTPVGTSGYYGVQIPVEAGAHAVTSFKPVGLQVYGLARYGDLEEEYWLGWDAYGYTGGVTR